MSGCQRWRGGRDSYRIQGERIRTSEYDVAPIEGQGSDNTCKQFVQEHHYSRSYPAARERFGLYRKGDLVGVAVFSDLFEHVKRSSFGDAPRLGILDLTRFVLLDEVPAYGETWFLGRIFRLLRQDQFRGVLSFADPLPRRRLDGTLITPGHVGTIYQAFNGTYIGQGRPDTLWLLPDGTALHERALVKIRKAERGWRPAVAKLVAHGATPLPEDAPEAWRRRWLEHWRAQLTREIAHPGNHKYVWRLSRSIELPPPQQYPKRQEVA